MRDKSSFSIEPILDSIIHQHLRPKPADVLYHYTDWTAARGIIANQHIWETAHDCLNDDDELLNAHEVILDVAHKLLRKSRGTATRALYQFIQAYERLQINKMKTVYLACFSVARDDPYQWKNYAGDGRGLCLGLRILQEPSPESTVLSSAMLDVDYSRASWQAYLRSTFTKICEKLAKVNCTPENIRHGMLALYRIAAFTSIRAKKPKWAPEREYRHITIIRDGIDFTPKKRNKGTKEISYLDDVVLRTDGKLLAFAEIIIGPNQESTKAENELIELLKSSGYTPNTIEYPTITVSALAPWSNC